MSLHTSEYTYVYAIFNDNYKFECILCSIVQAK